MIEARPDWCISRQRLWGVPIIAFHCKNCHHILLDHKIISHVADKFEEHGSDGWFSLPESELLPSGTKCPKCEGEEFVRDENIMDVWFDSGVSWSACMEREGINIPVDLYLEGSDQHRGWFHSSLLAGVATRGIAPYKAVLTHGFVVDGKGKKMSKSAGNYISPQVTIDQHGADILRLWVAAEDYRTDIRVSEEIITRLRDAYRRIRNTCRYILGNLNGFDPEKDKLPYDQMKEIDKWALHKLQELVERCIKAYEEYNFHVLYHSIHNFCVVDLSSFYLDVLKDRLYTSAPQSINRRSGQTVMYEIISAIARLLAPILSMTAEEVWSNIPGGGEKETSVFFTNLPKSQSDLVDETLGKRWERFLSIRGEITKAIEIVRGQKKIGHSLEAGVYVDGDKELLEFLDTFKPHLAELCIISTFHLGSPKGIEGLAQYESEEVKGLKITVTKAEGQKCERCWKYQTTIGQNTDHPTICTTCSSAIEEASRG
jgi:isoleucyl-tRNA synthetase